MRFTRYKVTHLVVHGDRVVFKYYCNVKMPESMKKREGSVGFCVNASVVAKERAKPMVCTPVVKPVLETVLL